MDRRNFIAAGLAAAPVAVATPAFAGRAAPAGVAGAGQGWKVLTTRVANRDQFAPATPPAPGARLALVRQRDRRYDANSIQVQAADGQPLGYLPPLGAATLAALLDAGFRAHALRVPAEGDALQVEVWLEGDLSGVAGLTDVA
ncbi:HIRAN domain-containing protein [Plastorhodobacter daqingensis]|uniref:HIRAN domain-containing protein n=1 Tax=Plastorhodobacter daqingensis TaxID=1387281 RepID=A0ABW2UJC5_9RHOB